MKIAQQYSAGPIDAQRAGHRALAPLKTYPNHSKDSNMANTPRRLVVAAAVIAATATTLPA